MPGMLGSAGRRGTATAAVAAAMLAVALVTAALALAAVQGHHRVHPRAKVARVAINGFAFHPHTLKVKRRTKVVFANSDSVPHTATRRGSFDTRRIRSGHSIAVRFARRGVFVYHCTIHPFMRGKIVVR